MSGLDLGPVQSFIDELLRNCVEFVVCPGSRSAPIVQALLTRENCQMHSVVDERSAAYQALGIAQANGYPAAVVTTSGTAAANLLPAVCEAYFARVPLLVITADRPAEWIGQEDNQAIHQRGLFHKHVLAEFETPMDATHPDSRWHMERVARDAIRAACHGGPVHVNMPFREPLYLDDPMAMPATFCNGSSPAEADFRGPYDEEYNQFKKARKPLFLSGQKTFPDKFELKNRSKMPVTGEILANLDGSLAPELWISNPDLMPDLVVTSGGAFVSKFVRQAIRSTGAEHWHLGEPRGAEPFQREVKRLDPKYLDQVQATDYIRSFQNAVETGRARRDNWLTSNDGGEIACIHAALESVPQGKENWDYRFHFGNSLVVRIACLVGEGKPGVRYHSNRGTSGIDGCLSTAVGHAVAHPYRRHFAILGDLSFFYDRNALWRDEFPENLRIIVINNGGGAIFDALPGPNKWGENTKWWTTPHRLTAEASARDHGLEYDQARTPDEVKRWVEQGWNGPALLEVFTDREQAAREFRDLLATLAQPH